MKKLRNLIAVMAMMSMAAVLTGCGDDDDDDDDDGPPVDNIVAPADEAALTAQNKTYTVTIPGDTNNIVLTFPSAGRYRAEQGGVAEEGAISGATRNVNTWTFNIAPDANQEGAQAGSVRLDFTAADQGTFTFTPTEGPVETGTFVLSTNPGGGDDGGNGGGGGEPAAGQTLQLAGERFDFISATEVRYEPQTANTPGTYTWDSTTRNLDINLNTGQRWQLTLPTTNGAETQVTYTDPNPAENETYSATATMSNTP